MNLAQVSNRDAPLIKYDFDNDHKQTLCDPTNPVVRLFLYLYQFESILYKTLNASLRVGDETKVKTIGPYGASLYVII